MNLFQMASRGVDLDALPEDDAPRSLIDFGPAPAPGARGTMPAQYNDLFDAAASEYGVDPTILKGLAYAESRFRPDVIDGTTRSSAGAVGLMQFMPATAKEMGINPLDPVESVFGAAQYLRQSLDKFGGDTERAIASYNWGRNRSAFDREDWFKSLPAETRNYVGTVLEFADGLAPAAAPAGGKAIPLPEGVAPSAAGGGRGMVNPEPGVNNYQGQAALNRNELAPLDEAARGVKTGITGLKQMWESNAVLKDATLAANMQERLDAFDRIDQGAKDIPRAIGLAYQQAGPEERQRLRGVVQKELGNRREFLDASLATIKQYQADMQRTKGRVAEFTDIEGVKDFTNWLAFNGGSGMASMAPLIVAAVTTGPLAPLAAGAVGYGMATGELNSDRIEYAQKQGLDNKGVADYVADKRGSTLGAAIPFAGLDVLAGPAGSVVKTATKGGVKELQRMGLKQAGKEVAKDTAEEAVTGGLQEMIKLGTGYGLDETQELLTKENAKKVLNSAAAEAAGGLTGGAARVSGTALVQQVRTPRVEDQPTTPQAPVVTAQPAAVPQAPVVDAAPAGQPTAPTGSNWSAVAAAEKQAQGEAAVMAKADALPAPTTRPSDAASTQAVDNIGALMGASPAPAAPQAAPTIEQAEQQLAAREAPAQAAPVEMQVRPTGTLLVKGDAPALRARLAAAGVDNTITVDGGLIVARSQAAQAQQALSAPTPASPAPQPAAATQQEAANVPQAQASAAQPAAQATSTPAPDIARTDAPVPAAGVPAAGTATAQPQADGVTGQKIDNEWTAFAPESGTRAVPRAEMPQIKAEHRGAMVNFLKARGVDATQEEVPASSLKPTQAEFSPAKVAQAKAYTGGDRSILVSSDGHVLDGHHQWLAKREAGDPVKVIRLDAPIADLLPLVTDFPSSTQAQGATAPQTAPVTPAPAADTFTEKLRANMALIDQRRELRQEISAAPDGQRAELEARMAKLEAKIQNGLAEAREITRATDSQPEPAATRTAVPAESAAPRAPAPTPPARPAPTTAGFKRWFADSKVVDDKGAPLVMYHGTSGNERGDAFTSFDTYASNYGLMGQGSYFTADPAVASSYTAKGKGPTPSLYPVYLSIKNPIDMDAKADPAQWQAQFPDAESFHEGGDTNESWYRATEESLRDQSLPMWEGAEAMQEGLRAMGYDGITHVGGGRVDSAGVRHRVYIAFDPEQIKSATGNNGQFDPANPDIRFSRGANQPATLADVERQLTMAGIAIDVSERGDVVTLSRIVVPEGQRDGGKGTAAMQALVDYADQNGKHLVLSPSADFGGDKKRLVGFYKRFGFVENKGRNRAFSTKESMYREAQGKTLYSKGMSRELAEAIMAIRPPARAQMATKDSVQAALEQLVPAGGRLPNGLGRIVVANAAEIAPQWEPLIGRVDIASEDAGRAQGFYDPRTKTVFLIADHIRAGDEMAVAAHELMHKHGQAVLGAEGWDRLHSTIEQWADAPEGSTERQVYDEAVARVEASRPDSISIPEYTTQELFPYAVQVALEMGVQPSALKPVSTVAGWLAHVRGALRRVWNKIANPKGDFNSLDLVNLAYGIAQRENPAHRGELDGLTQARAEEAATALQRISEAGDLFALPKSAETTVAGIAAEHSPGITVRETDLGGETMHTLTMPDGSTATITSREPSADAVYGMDEATGQWITERPGENAPPTGSKADVWVDVSRLQPGRWGGVVYNIAATYAHNTGRIFIGDPSGLSDVAMRRRAEQMLGSALKFGTTDHLAPHPRQVAGDAGLGVPPLRWVYGDTAGNIQRLIDVNQAALENAFPDARNLTYDLDTGNFRDSQTGTALSREDLVDAGRGARKEADALRAGAGWRTLARGAVFRALLGRRAEGNDSTLDSGRDATRAGRGGVLDRAGAQPAGPAPTGDARDERGSGTLAGLAGEVGRLGTDNPGRRLFYSRSAGPVTPAADKPALQWRDTSGHLQFAPGDWLYQKLGAAAAPMLTALGLKAATPELRRQLRMMKLQVQRAQELSAKVATEAAKLSATDRAMVSDLVEKDLQAGTIPPEHAVKLASIISTTMDQQSKELVELGMLSKESAERWEGTYLPRFYESKLTKKVGDAWADAMRRLVGRPRLMKGIGGKHLKGRGIFETIDPASLENYQALGWEVRDPDYVPGTSTEVQVWRDFNREERQKMGEIRDAGFRFVMGYMQTQKDIALGRMFQNLANDDRFSSRLPTTEMTVRVPDTKVEGTGAHTYGKLAGRYVSKETLSHLSSFDEVHNDTLQMYRQAMSLWKEGKTVLNPVAHMNNVVSNLTMAHLAGISYHRGDKYLGALADFIKGSPMIEDAKDAGLFLGNFSQSELMEQMPDDLKKLVNLQEGLGAKSTKTAMAVMTMLLRKPMGRAYEFEDSFFKYMLYKDARKRGLDQQDAIDYAQRYIFTYDDLPKGARRIRDFGIPFFAYTYKAVPALLHTAMAHPVRMATPAALLWATTALTYAAMADGDDDTPWDELAKKYLTDAEFRKKTAEAREFDQKHMPTWMRGSTAFFTPKTMRVGYDKVMDLPVFLDISRFIPGGDLFDVTPNAGGVPLPQPITPNHPLLTMAMGMLGNKDMFTGKELVDKNDTKGEAAEKRAAWIYRQVAPAVAVGQYHWNRGMEMVAQASGGEITWLPDFISERFTGIGTDGLPVLPEYGIPQTFGIKIRPMDQDRAEAIERAMDKKLIQSIDADIRALARQNRNGTLSDKAFEKQRDYQREKRDRLKEGLTVDGNEKE